MPCADHFAPETTMHQLHPRQDGSDGHVGTSSRITRQDLMRKARHLADRHRPKAGAVLTLAAAHLHRRQLETAPYQELAAAARAEVITPGDRGYDKAPRSVSQRC
jgi:hypothetical protein